MEKQKSSAPEGTELGDLILPEKKKVGHILSKLDLDVNFDEFNLVLGPFFDIMRRMEGRR